MRVMNYYLVAVASGRYHGHEPLTYAHESNVAPGTIVQVPLQRQQCLGFILAPTDKPSFETKPLTKVYDDIPALPKQLIGLYEWLRAYYRAPVGMTTQLFLPKDLPERTRTLKPTANMTSNKPLPPLTAEQEEAIQVINAPGSYLVHGETGSGKTRLYMELASRTLAAEKSCIILTPEISLTSQLAQEFSRVIGPDRLFVIHSQLTAAARRKLWLTINSATQPIIIIGPRSALFSPLRNIGLIVLDEAHEPAYKQESSPYYHAARVAAQLAHSHAAILILGSATPTVAEYFYAEQKSRPIIRLTKPAIADSVSTEVDVITVDMRDKNNLSTTYPLSHALITQINEAMSNNLQTLLFLNRRGTARIVLCENCGWQANCPHCDLPLTYHHDSHSLRCHTCSFHEKAYSSCPSCGNADISLKSAGTKAILTAVQKKFPMARIARFDADNLTGERLHELYEEIRSGEIDILIGTQLLAKGLDLPRLGLVGVLNADASLYIPDFTAQERTYQLLYQLIGRVGRGHQTGTVVVQTYSPDNATIQAATDKDWERFYQAELKERKTFLFPPYCHMLKLSCRRATSASAQKAAETVAEILRAAIPRIIIDGPAPAFHEKIQNKYVWQLIIKSKERQRLLEVISALPSDWYYDIDPVDLL